MLEKLNSRWNSAAGLHQLAIQYKAILRLGALTKCLFPQSCCCRIAKFQILEILGKLPRLLFNRCARCNLSNFQDTFDNFYIPANFNNFLFWQFWQCPEVLKKYWISKFPGKKSGSQKPRCLKVFMRFQGIADSVANALHNGEVEKWSKNSQLWPIMSPWMLTLLTQKFQNFAICEKFWGEHLIYIQGLSERMIKVNPFARALIFTKNGFSEVFWDEK